MLTVTFLLLSVACGIWFFRRRKRLQSSVAKLALPPLYVLLTDGRVSALYPAERLDGGSVRVDGAEYASSMLIPVDNISGMPGSIYICAIEPLALVKHRSLEQYRAAVIKGALFKSGGDLVQLMQICAAAAVICAALFVWWQTSAVIGMVANVQSAVERVEEWTKVPLEIKVKP